MRVGSGKTYSHVHVSSGGVSLHCDPRAYLRVPCSSACAMLRGEGEPKASVTLCKLEVGNLSPRPHQHWRGCIFSVIQERTCESPAPKSVRCRVVRACPYLMTCVFHRVWSVAGNVGKGVRSGIDSSLQLSCPSSASWSGCLVTRLSLCLPAPVSVYLNLT